MLYGFTGEWRKRKIVGAPNTVVSVMRYVVGILLVVGAIVWDAVYLDGRYLALTIRGLRNLLVSVGLG
jgi:hypothetical protein